MQRWLRGLTRLAALALLASPGVSAAQQDDASVYRERFERFMRDPTNFAYEPVEPVTGVRRYRPIAQVRPGESRIDATALESAVRYAEANRSTAFIVWRDGRLESEQYFGGTRANTLLPSKSLSKPLTAIAVGRAIVLGHIRSLDQPVADFIHEWRGTDRATMRIRHLLDMRSGLLDQGFSPDPNHPWNQAFLGLDHGRYIVEHYPLTHSPGTRYGYANAPSELVALVIERATGRRYADFIGREVLRPIGAQGGEIWINRAGGLAHSGCCLMLPAQDWLRMAILLINDGRVGNRRLLSRGYVAEMLRGTPENRHYGLGVWLGSPWQERRGFGAPGAPGPQVLHSAPYRDPGLYLFDGNASQTVHISPAHRLIILRMGANPPRSPEWDNAYLPNLLIDGLRRR
ncbi:beta-lactamase family protein [Sphingomonas lacunae]|uniref:Beta-lactamase family protein n=1 Tax=Sphingomonas lacunae TaxID=2698828 RepID=A0A6M4ASJ2_9SPHN|nr:serine hydrolase domain-containing protein [Sphingomonas lacunae]QJQ32058.1 beta-lactamase family protein [Sphingomonas lacunae]